MLGAYTKAELSDKEVITAAKFALNAQSQAIQRSNDHQPSKLQLLKVIRAEQQVVSGMNYRLTLRVRQGNKQRKAEAIVWWQAWRANPYQLTSWTWE